MEACAHIVWGYALEENVILPWGDGDEVEWWLDVTGYSLPQDDDDVASWDAEDHFDHKMGWLSDHKMPFEMARGYRTDYPLWVISIPERGVYATHDSMAFFSLPDLVVTKQEILALNSFCVQYGVDTSPNVVPSLILVCSLLV